MKQIKWFERKFTFPFDQNIFPSILERLEGTPLRLKDKLSRIKETHLKEKVDGSWSIQENIGHILDLEPLWMGRLGDILDGNEIMREADLENLKTHHAQHNDNAINELFKTFESERKKMVIKLKTLNDKEVFMHSLHPRLKTPLRIIDLFLFVAEHDDHHLARITEINEKLNSN